MQNSLNFRIQNHKLKLVEVEGTHTLQTTYSSFDLHVGQSASFLLTADQPAQDYYIVVSSRFTDTILTTTGTLHYSNSAGAVSGPIPGGPTIQIDWSLNQARSIRYIYIIVDQTEIGVQEITKNSYLNIFCVISGPTSQLVDQDRTPRVLTIMVS